MWYMTLYKKCLQTGGPMTRKILIIDDEKTTRLTVKKHCKQLKHALDTDILEAGNRQEALILFEENRDNIAIIFVDGQMPESGEAAVAPEIAGLTFVTAVYETCKMNNIPIICISSDTGEEQRNAFGKYDVTHFTGKPVTPAKLKGIFSQIDVQQQQIESKDKESLNENAAEINEDSSSSQALQTYSQSSAKKRKPEDEPCGSPSIKRTRKSLGSVSFSSSSTQSLIFFEGVPAEISSEKQPPSIDKDKVAASKEMHVATTILNCFR